MKLFRTDNVEVVENWQTLFSV